MTAQILMYEKYGPAGTVVLATDCSWKSSPNGTDWYYEFPIIRPTNDIDQTCSYTKWNYFRIVNAAKVKDVSIKLISPYTTNAFGYIQANKPYILYGGSGISTENAKIDIYTDVNKGFLLGTANINTVTNEIESVRLANTFSFNNQPFSTAIPDAYKFDSWEIPDISESQKRVKNTRLYYALRSGYNTPTDTHDWDMICAGIGNVTVQVPMLPSPNTVYSSIESSYTGLDLYTPYFVTQLRVNNSEWDDVGNSPQYKILLKCKIF